MPELCLRIWKDLQLDMNWRRRLNVTNQLATLHTGGSALMTNYQDNSRPVCIDWSTHTQERRCSLTDYSRQYTHCVHGLIKWDWGGIGNTKENT